VSRTQAQAQAAPVAALTCIPGGCADDRAAARLGAWGAEGDELWPAWAAMAEAELQVFDALGEELGSKLLVL
jgi:hypothetical protein